MDAVCPGCREESRHAVLSGSVRRDGTLDCTAKCASCGRVGNLTIEAEKPREVRIVVSSGDKSEPVRMVLPDGSYNVGDEMMVLDKLCEVTAIEGVHGRCIASPLCDIETIWARDITEVGVKLSINVGRETRKAVYTVGPDYELSVGDVLETSIGLVIVHAIKNREKLLETGSALAKDIVRVYCRPARVPGMGGKPQDPGAAQDLERTGRAHTLRIRNEPGRKEKHPNPSRKKYLRKRGAKQ